MEWWKKQEDKRKERMNSNTIQRLNLELVGIIREIKPLINKDDYRLEVSKLSKHLAQCNIWDVIYSNNLESPKVLLDQALLIHTVINREEKVELYQKANNLDSIIYQAMHIEFEILNQFNRYKDNLDSYR